jgi:hypothetical protein
VSRVALDWIIFNPNGPISIPASIVAVIVGTLNLFRIWGTMNIDVRIIKNKK